MVTFCTGTKVFKNVKYDKISRVMSKKTIISLQFKGHRFQVIEERIDWRTGFRYDVLQDRRILCRNCTLIVAAYQLIEIIHNNFCRV